MHMRYLVLGSSGQIGAPLVSYLRGKGHVVATHDIVDSKEEDLRINNDVLLRDKLKDSDFVFFLAFDVGGSRYLEKYQHTFSFINNNISIMRNVFSELNNTKKKFVFASSQMSEMGFSPYGVCKAIGEKYTLSLNGVIARFWNVYGPEKDLEKSHVITDFVNMAKNDKHIKMLTDGSERRQFLYVDDCCECLYLLSKKYDIIDKTREYHVTSFQWNSIRQIADIISKNFNNIPVDGTQKKDMIQRNINTEPNTNVLSFWSPKTDIESGVKMVIEKMS